MQDALYAAEDKQADFADGPDMFFGVFQSVGEDLGFDPFYLRAAFLAGLLLSPVAMTAAYAALGAVVALSRWLFPTPRPSDAGVAPVEQRREPELIAA